MKTKEHLKKDGLCRSTAEGGAGASEMSCGGGGGGRLDEGGVLARAAALGDGHLWLLLQFDVDHCGRSVKCRHPCICAFQL